MANHPNRHLSPSMRALLARISRATDGDGAFLTLTIQANGDMAKARKLRDWGWIEACYHPTIVAAGSGAPAVRVTDTGRAALRGS